MPPPDGVPVDSALPATVAPTTGLRVRNPRDIGDYDRSGKYLKDRRLKLMVIWRQSASSDEASTIICTGSPNERVPTR